MAISNQFVSIEFLGFQLDLAVQSVIAFTKQFVEVEPIRAYRFVHFAGAGVLPNYPYNNRIFLHTQNDYIDVDKKLLDREELLTTLCFNNEVPTWININMLDIRDGTCVFEVWSGFQSTNDFNRLMHHQEGIPPFHCLSPVLPPNYAKGQKFSLPSNPAYKHAINAKG